MRPRGHWIALLAAIAAPLPLAGQERGLKSFVEAGLANDLSFQSAVASSALGEGQWRAALATFTPKVVPAYSYSREQSGSQGQAFGLGVTWDTGFGASLSGSYVRSDLGTGVTPGLGWSTDRNLQVTVPLGSQFGRLPARVTLEGARATRNSAERALVDARQRSILDIVQTYYAYLQAQKSYEVAEQSVKRASRNHEITQMKYRLGEINRIDVDRAQQLLQQTQFTAVTARNEVVRIRSVIENVYGASDVGVFAFRIPAVEKHALEWEDAEVVRMAIAADPGIASGREQLEVARLNLKLAGRQFLPDIDANYRVGSREGGAATGVGSSDVSYHQFSVTSNLSLDYSGRRLALLNAQVAVRTQELGLRQLEQNLRSQLESQLQSFSRKRELVDLSRLSLETSRSQTELADLRFEKGIGSAFDVVDSQAQLQSSELQFLSAEVDLILSYYEILYRLQLLDLDRLIE